MKTYKPKICKSCGSVFTPERSFQSTCGYSCAIDYANALIKKKNEKEKRKAIKESKENHIPTLKKKAQDAFNAYIRARDGKKCISCGYEGEKRQFHAGHFMSQGGNSILRFDERNVHAQCAQCNTYLSGNLTKYEENLIGKIGIDAVEELKATKGIKKWTAEELKSIITVYRMKERQLRD